MAQSTKPPIFDVIDIEREIEEEFRKQPSARESQPADFATEIGAALGSLEDGLRSTPITQRPIHQARAVGTREVLLDDRQVLLRLLQ